MVPAIQDIGKSKYTSTHLKNKTKGLNTKMGKYADFTNNKQITVKKLLKNQLTNFNRGN